jgi:large subunit ribosomal protein L10
MSELRKGSNTPFGFCKILFLKLGIITMKLQGKREIVEHLYARLSKAQIVILTDYKGLNSETINSLRRNLREANAEYQVIKNTLLKRALEKAELNFKEEFFKGSTAIALTYDDPVALAKVLSNFAKENEKLEIKYGIMSKEILDVTSIKELSKLPSREILLSQLLCVLNGVSTSFVRALNDLPCRLVNVLNAIKDKKEA